MIFFWRLAAGVHTITGCRSIFDNLAWVLVCSLLASSCILRGLAVGPAVLLQHIFTLPFLGFFLDFFFGFFSRFFRLIELGHF